MSNPFKDWTPQQVAAFNSRIKVTASGETKFDVPIQQESELHLQIMAYCDKQWPRGKYTHARMDKRSTLEKGHCDFVIWLPIREIQWTEATPIPTRYLLIECKRPGQKPDEDQRNWIHEMERLGHTVHVIESFEQFLELVK